MELFLTVSDPDVYCGQARKPNGKYYYELLLVYVYDLLCCPNNPNLITDALSLAYYMKDGSVGPPKIYLCSEINKYMVMSGKSHCSMVFTQKGENSINMVEGLLNDEYRQLRKFKSTLKQTLPNGYQP